MKNHPQHSSILHEDTGDQTGHNRRRCWWVCCQLIVARQMSLWNDFVSVIVLLYRSCFSPTQPSRNRRKSNRDAFPFWLSLPCPLWFTSSSQQCHRLRIPGPAAIAYIFFKSCTWSLVTDLSWRKSSYEFYRQCLPWRHFGYPLWLLEHAI